jgi:hypothetical protein
MVSLENLRNSRESVNSVSFFGNLIGLSGRPESAVVERLTVSCCAHAFAVRLLSLDL